MGLGGATIVTTAALVVQWRYASLGRQVSRNVTKFLKDHGAQVRDGVISGGVVAAPLKVNAAVNATVVQMLNAVADQLEEESPNDGPDEYIDNPTYVRQRKLTTKKGSTRPKTRRSVGKQTDVLGKIKPSARNPAHPMGNSPLGIGQPPDDGGYGNEKQHETKDYDPNEFSPKRGTRPPEKSVFTDDEVTVGPVDDDDYQ